MKKLIIIFALILSLTACSEPVDNTKTCDEGFELINNECEPIIKEESKTITFNTGEGSLIEDITVLAGTIIELTEPVQEGYSFLGWVRNTNRDVLLPETFEVTDDETLYAKWQVNQYLITFNTNGGNQLDSVNINYDDSIHNFEVPVMEGYTFMGWFLDASFNDVFNIEKMPAHDIELYALWEKLDTTEIDLYLSGLFPMLISTNIDLPELHQSYEISWSSSDQSIIDNNGNYTRPYHGTEVILTASVSFLNHTIIREFEVDVAGYKSLDIPFRSSYIYRDYNAVDDSFFSTLDVINCAFLTANSDGTIHGTSVLRNIETYIMPKAKENGNWVVFSIAPESEWSSIASSNSRIETFANNIVDIINEYGFDGVDIDWETPTPDESERFTELMRIVYEKVKENNENHLVTAAVSGGMWQPPKYDLTNAIEYIDYINMMTYGMVSNNGYYQNALYESKTYANQINLAGKTLTSCSIEESIEIFNSYGVPNNKIVVGVAFYGIKQTRSYNTVNQTWSNWTKEESVSFSYISNYYLNNDEYRYYYDSNAGVPYIMSTNGKVFISYDNPRSIAEKSEFIVENGLAGIMYWENGLDGTGSLLLAIESSLTK